MPCDAGIVFQTAGRFPENRTTRRCCGKVANGALHSGKKPSTSAATTSLCVHVDRDGAADQFATASQAPKLNASWGPSGEASSVSLAARQECHSATDCQGSRSTSLLGRNARQPGGPAPNPCCRRRQANGCRRPIVCSTNSPPSSDTPTSVKSVVPPPTSQTSSLSPTFELPPPTRLPHRPTRQYTAACGSSMQYEISPAVRRPAPRRGSARGRWRRTKQAQSAQHAVRRAERRGKPPAKRRPSVLDIAATPSPVRSAWHVAREHSRARIGWWRSTRLWHKPTTWPLRPFGAALRLPAAAPSRRRQSRRLGSNPSRVRPVPCSCWPAR